MHTVADDLPLGIDRIDAERVHTTVGTLGSNGRPSARVGGTKKGTYTTTIDSVTKDGIAYDDNINTDDPVFVHQ